MEEEEVDTGQPVEWTVVHNVQGGVDLVRGGNANDEVPLLVAMQPEVEVDVPAVEIGEVVIVTEGTEEVVESQAGETDGSNVNYMQVSTVEEVVEAAPCKLGNILEVAAFQEGDIDHSRIIARCVDVATKLAKVKTEPRPGNHPRPKGRVAVAKAPPPSSSSESESEDSSDQPDDNDDSGLRKIPKKREFAHRYG